MDGWMGGRTGSHAHLQCSPVIQRLELRLLSLQFSDQIADVSAPLNGQGVSYVLVQTLALGSAQNKHGQQACLGQLTLLGNFK
jgi:hypothetical protein